MSELPILDLSTLSENAVTWISHVNLINASLLAKQLNLTFPTTRFLAWVNGPRSQFVLESYCRNPIHTTVDDALKAHNDETLLSLFFDNVQVNLPEMPNTRVTICSELVDYNKNIDYLFLGKQKNQSRLHEIWETHFQIPYPEFSQFSNEINALENNWLVLDTMTQDCYQFKANYKIQSQMPDINREFLSRLPLSHLIQIETVEKRAKLTGCWKAFIRWCWSTL